MVSSDLTDLFDSGLGESEPGQGETTFRVNSGLLIKTGNPAASDNPAVSSGGVMPTARSYPFATDLGKATIDRIVAAEERIQPASSAGSVATNGWLTSKGRIR